MLRIADLVLLLVPFAVFFAWRRLPIGASPAVLAGVAVALGLFGAGLVWLARSQALPRSSSYVPARIENGRISPGHGTRP
jgi:hypothetical protein